MLQFDLARGRVDGVSVQRFNDSNKNSKNTNSIHALECLPYHPACVPAQDLPHGGRNATNVCVGTENGAHLFDLHNPQQPVVNLYQDNTILYSQFDYNTNTLVSCGVQR